jgi:hypothetical protein
MEIKRGYVKWIDPVNGDICKAPLYEFPELLETATARQKADAEALRELNDGSDPD